MTLKQYLGAAATQALAAGITNSALSFTTSDSTGMPGGGTAPFVVVLELGTPKEEKVLVDSRSANTYTVNASGRGYDGTAAVAHNSGAPVQHCIDAVSIQEVNAHVNDTGRDDHIQYLNTTRHDVAGRHTFGAALGTPSAPAAVGTSAAAGAASGPAKADHVHIIGTGAISAATMFGSAVIPAAAFQSGAVPKGITVGTHAAIPAGTQGDMYLESDTHRLFLFDNSKWNYIMGGTDPTAARAFLSANVLIPANANTKIVCDTESWDYGSCYNAATGVYTVPTQGIYHVIARVGVQYNQNPQGFGIGFWLNGSQVSGGVSLTERNMTGGDIYGLVVTDILSCVINDTIEFRVFNGAATNNINVSGEASGSSTFITIVKN